MNMEKIKVIQLELSQFFKEMDKTRLSGDENCVWEEQFYRLERLKDCIDSMIFSYEDVVHGYRTAMKILTEWKHTGNVVQIKLENPYHPIDFGYPQQRHRHAYA